MPARVFELANRCLSGFVTNRDFDPSQFDDNLNSGDNEESAAGRQFFVRVREAVTEWFRQAANVVGPAIKPLIDVLDGIGLAAHASGHDHLALVLNGTAFTLRILTNRRVRRSVRTAAAATVRALAAARRCAHYVIIRARSALYRAIRAGWARIRRTTRR
ncbi:hypothetical protein ACTD5D_40850 [Nocardia takedensis]|uniref:hypothetical protein n=1 Tax=Nocardia takedensis TaxID=259390 RepID=UPI003F766B29